MQGRRVRRIALLAGKPIECRVTATGAGGSVVADSTARVSARACIVPKLASDKEPGTVLSSPPKKGANRPAGAKVALTVAK
jgi:hypothetical protein